MGKKTPDQLDANGLSFDYNQHLGQLYAAFDLTAYKEEKLYRELVGLGPDDYILDKVSFQTYLEIFPSEEYLHENAAAVNAVNEMGLEIQKLLHEKSTDFGKIYGLMDGIYFRINGKHLEKPKMPEA